MDELVELSDEKRVQCLVDIIKANTPGAVLSKIKEGTPTVYGWHYETVYQYLIGPSNISDKIKVIDGLLAIRRGDSGEIDASRFVFPILGKIESRFDEIRPAGLRRSLKGEGSCLTKVFDEYVITLKRRGSI